MDILANERRRAEMGNDVGSSYKRQLEDLKDKKAVLAVNTAGDHIKAQADRVKAQLEPLQGAFQTTSDARKAYDKIKGKYDKLKAKTSGKTEPTKDEIGETDTDSSRVARERLPGRQSLAGQTREPLPGAPTKPIPDEPPSYIKRSDPKFASMSPEELEANRSARKEAGRVMTNNIKKNLTYRNQMDAYRKGGVPSGDDGASSSFMDERARAGTANPSRDLRALTGNDPEQGGLSSLHNALAGNPARDNPHSLTQFPKPEGEATEVGDVAGDVAKKVGGEVGSKLATGLGIAGDVLDALGPLGDLIGIGLSIFGGVEAGKEHTAEATAETQATHQLDKPPPRPEASTGATFSTLKGMGQAPVSTHF